MGMRASEQGLGGSAHRALPGEGEVTENLGFYEFFAGGGLARLGLEPRWRCLVANEICPKKARAYRENFDDASALILKDVRELTTADLPGRAMLSWASFPCQDLSLAGNRGGLKAERSGTFWPFYRLMESLVAEGRPTPIIVLENVVGAITSNGGKDLAAVLNALAEGGYFVGPMVIDAIHFVPQSRSRLFVLAVWKGIEMPPALMAKGPLESWHPGALKVACAASSRTLGDRWIWWNLPAPAAARAGHNGARRTTWRRFRRNRASAESGGTVFEWPRTVCRGQAALRARAED